MYVCLKQVVPLAPVLIGGANPAFIRETLCRNFDRKVLIVFNLLGESKVVEFWRKNNINMIIDKKQINKKDGRTKKERKKETNKQTKHDSEVHM